MARWDERNVGDQSGRVALVTGANSGIGFHTARVLAEHGAHVLLGCRNEEKGNAARGRISGSTELARMDLGDLASVRDAAAKIRANHDRIDLLVNNAGVLTFTRQQTRDGFESQIGINHLGHFALTGLLVDRLLAAPGSRVVSVGSNAHRAGRVDPEDLHWQRRPFRPWRAYGTSKLANLLFAFELERRLRAAGTQTHSLAAHPGGTYTALGRPRRAGILGLLDRIGRPITRLVLQDAAAGALPTVRAATDAEAEGGEYYGPRGPFELRGTPVRAETSARARDMKTARRLWEASADQTGVTYEALEG